MVASDNNLWYFTPMILQLSHPIITLGVGLLVDVKYTILPPPEK